MPWHFCYIFPLVATLLIEKGEEKSNEIKYFIKNSLRVNTHTKCVNTLRAVEQPHWLAPCFCPEPCKLTISSHCAGQVLFEIQNSWETLGFSAYISEVLVFLFFFFLDTKKKVKKNYSWSANPSLISHPQPHPTRTPPPSAWEYTAVLNSLQKTS